MTNPTQHRQNLQTELPLPPSAENAPLVSSVRSGEPSSSSIRSSEAEAPLTKTTEFQWKFAEETHQYIREYIRQADQKAAFFFAGSTTLIAFLYKTHLIQIWLISPKQWLCANMLSFAATIGLTASALACLYAVIPRLRGSKRGLLFFSAISEFESKKDYTTDVLQCCVQDLIEAKLNHVHDLADICREKFAVLKIGLWSGAIGVSATVLLLLFSP